MSSIDRAGSARFEPRRGMARFGVTTGKKASMISKTVSRGDEMKKLTDIELQQKLDIQKWVDSQANGADTCGKYEYCEYCDKTAENPCAKAYLKAHKPAAPAKKPAAKKPAPKACASSAKKTCASPAKKPCAKKTTKQ